MNAALAAAVAVALLAIVALVLTARRASARVAAERSRAEILDVQLSEAERDRALAIDRAEVADRRAGAAAGGLAAAGAVWELERLRLEREWAEVTGTAAPLPEPWDGSIPAAIAVELELIREVMGVPSSVVPLGDWGAPDPAAAVAGFRLTAEILRSLARVGDEIAVTFGADGVVTMKLATHGDSPQPDLARPEAAAAALGAELTLLPIDGGFVARLRLPADAGGK